MNYKNITCSNVNTLEIFLFFFLKNIKIIENVLEWDPSLHNIFLKF